MARDYAVEVNNEKGFVRQINIFCTYEEAEDFMATYDGLLYDGEYLNITFIEYDENGYEIGRGNVWC